MVIDKKGDVNYDRREVSEGEKLKGVMAKEVPLEVLHFNELKTAASAFGNPHVRLHSSQFLLRLNADCEEVDSRASDSVFTNTLLCDPSNYGSSHAPPQSEGSHHLDAAMSTLQKMLRALGPDGPGLMAVRGVPRVNELRKRLLPMAQTLARIPHLELRTILKDNSLGTDVQLKKVDRPISSFTAQVDFGKLQVAHQIAIPMDGGCREAGSTELSTLGHLFRTLGTCFAELGLLVARLCDVAFPYAGLEQSILDSGTAKGRLIHYHSPSEILTEKRNLDKRVAKQNKAIAHLISPQRYWQQWHYDYGILTIVTAPMFRSALSHSMTQFAASAECLPPDGHSCLHIMNPMTGLAQYVVVSDDLVIAQVGEAAQILSGGRLRATAHCVSEVMSSRSVSRETFVLFLHPAWQKDLSPPQGYNRDMVLGTTLSPEEQESNRDDSLELITRIAEFNKNVPPLQSRWHESSTFAEFSKQTTKQYYGANGCQSRN